jgi:tRNA (guanosine-2'-O-)-methyltransferase
VTGAAGPDAAAARLGRIRAALDARLGRVSCAIEAVHHRHNVSAILRTCDALGVHRVDLVEGHFTPTRGAARGAERWLDIRHHTDPDDAIGDLTRAGFAVYVADLDDDGVPPEEVPVDRPVCLWFGAELEGVAPSARAAAAGVVQIPMRGLAQSLNVSVAAAVAMRPVAERARALGREALLDDATRDATWRAWLAREEKLLAVARARGEWSFPKR